jgi:methylthioribose-1-phosphate isomerase
LTVATGRKRQAFATLRWRNGRLQMIDQRVLPRRVDYLEFDSAAGVARGIRSMVVRGAPAIGCAAAYGVALEALRLSKAAAGSFAAKLDDACKTLGESRPTAVNLFWALARMRAKLQQAAGQRPPAIARLLLQEAHAVLAEDIANNRRMGGHGAALLVDGMRVLTHCNAGALATGGHGTALGVIRSAVEAGKRIEVIADETRPFLQGARLTAWEMEQERIPVTLIADNSAGYLMWRGEIDAVIVGADRIAANGDVVNKIGTCTVAVLALRHGIPFYVAAPLSTFDVKTASGRAIPIEEREGAEVRGYGKLEWAPRGVAVRNPVFDVTPAGLISAIITEQGVLTPPYGERIRALFAAQSSPSA